MSKPALLTTASAVLCGLLIIGTLLLLANTKDGGGHLDQTKVQVRSQISYLRQVITIYKFKNDSYPETLNALLTGEQKFIREIPKDPWGNPYVYTLNPPGGQPYLIISYGADGVPGGTNAAADVRSDDWESY